MRWQQQVQYASLSDIGIRRRNNQDKCVVRLSSDEESWKRNGHLFLVADGMGGHAVGELASEIAAETVPHTYFRIEQDDLADALKQSIEQANNAIHERAAHNREFERMGTTCSAIVLTPHGAIIGHVGDSRVYRVRNTRIDQLTFDHSLHWELLKRGRKKPEGIDLEQTRHVITRSLGPEPTVQVDIEGPLPILPGDVYVLCSDGLTGHLNDAEIGLVARLLPPPDACRLLVNLANLRGGSDNVTVVIARVGDSPDGQLAEPESDEQTVSAETRLSGWWLAGIGAIGLMLTAAVALFLVSRPREGVIVSSAAVLVLFGLLAAWMGRRSAPQESSTDAEASETSLSSPYRTSKARFERRLLNQLVRLESQLQQTATDEGWEVDWEKHKAAFDAARQATSQGRLQRAFAELAEAIDLLMGGMQLQRRQLNHEQRWGKKADG